VSLEFFVDIILPCRTMALGSTQALAEMRGKGGRCLGLTTLPPSCVSNFWNPQGLYRGWSTIVFMLVFNELLFCGCCSRWWN
jgi:hypothetical protein